MFPPQVADRLLELGDFVGWSYLISEGFFSLKDHIRNADLTEDNGTSINEPITPTETKQLTIETVLETDIMHGHKDQTPAGKVSGQISQVAIEEKMTGDDKTAPQDVGDNMLSSTLVENNIYVPHVVSNSSDMEVVTNSDKIS